MGYKQLHEKEKQMIQNPEVAKDIQQRLGTILVETVESIRNGAGPVADRIIGEYAARSWFSAISHSIASSVSLLVMMICIWKTKRLIKANADVDSIGWMIFLGIISLIVFMVLFYNTINHGQNAISPLYSLIKELTGK